MRRISIALFASLATLAFALPAAAEEPVKTDTTPAPAATATTPPAPAAEKPSSGSIEEHNREFLGKGSLIIGAERVFGFSSSTLKPKDTDAIKTTQWGILWGAGATNVFQIPRMAIDYVAFDQVTFGGSFGLAHTSTTTPARDMGTVTIPESTNGQTNWIFAPRAGYIFGGKGVLSLWVRAGFSVWSMPVMGMDSTWGTALNFEPEIIISPWKHVGVYLGGVVDFGLFGKATPVAGADSASYNVTNFGATGGLRAWF
jgi:hypothetical protein